MMHIDIDAVARKHAAGQPLTFGELYGLRGAARAEEAQKRGPVELVTVRGGSVSCVKAAAPPPTAAKGITAGADPAKPLRDSITAKIDTIAAEKRRADPALSLAKAKVQAWHEQPGLRRAYDDPDSALLPAEYTAKKSRDNADAKTATYHHALVDELAKKRAAETGETIHVARVAVTREHRALRHD
jgi:hypothetical protein